MSQKEQFLSSKNRYRPISLPEEFSDEEMVRDWTLSESDQDMIGKFRKQSRLFIAIQLCAVRLYGRFLHNNYDIAPRIIAYLNSQLDLPPTLHVQVPEREATYLAHRKKVLSYLGFGRFDERKQRSLSFWIKNQARKGLLPYQIFPLVEDYLISDRVLLPGPTVLERQIIRDTSEVHTEIFESIYNNLPFELRSSIDSLLTIQEGANRSFFYELKEYPPAATISSLKTYLSRYQTLEKVGIDIFNTQMMEPAFQEYLFKLTKKYNAKELKRFNKYKRYALMICFLLESRQALLDHLVRMHDQYVMEILRESKNTYERKHRDLRQRQKRAVSVIINASRHLLDWPEDLAMPLATLWDDIGRENFKNSIDTFKAIKHLTECGLGELWLARYPSMRKYFADFIQLPFRAEKGSEHLLESIELIRRIDAGEVKQLPKDVSLSFVPKELRPLLYDKQGKIKRNAWEMGLAIAMKDAIRSGDLFLPESKQHVSFWNFLVSNSQWEEVRQTSYQELAQPTEEDVRPVLTQQFQEVLDTAQTNFLTDNFASIVDGKLKLKKNDKLTIPDSITRLQKFISASLPLTRIEKLLMEVDQHTQFSQAFQPIQGHRAKPKLFYKSLMSALISQATNLGVVAMSASVNDVSVDMLRHVQNYFIREETIKAANAMIVDRHHELPLSKIYGSGTVSSSDAQRFGIRASSLLASYYPRYYGYYEKAYTHVSDQYSVFSTKVISCGPREALYVLDGLLENNTVLSLKNHTTDTHGYTEIIFALCHLLGFYFMPRIRDLKNQQLYRIDKNMDYGVFNSLLNKTADLPIIVEQWDEMIRIAYSLINRTAPAHLVVQRLMNSYPSDRLSKAFTNLGRIIKTQYILRYLSDKNLRLAVQRQLNKGEYRHKLPRWIFFASQGEFTVGDYEEIMNKASCLSLISNAILYWNTLRIQMIVDDLRLQGEDISDEALSHISLLPYRHVLPNGTYFIEDFEGDFGRKPTV